MSAPSSSLPTGPDLRACLGDLPLVAILRGLVPDAAADIGAALVAAGFRIIEVPLNSPQPFASIERLARALSGTTVIGAGTVLEPEDVERVRDAGGRLVVMPHSDRAVIARARERGLACTPGVATPTEAFAALAAGADALKMFPAEAMPPPVVKAWRAVLPPDTLLLPVGGIRPDNMRAFVAAGANGFGLGSALFSPQLSAAEVAANARAFVDAWRALGA
jgi:2-dehydro-3-deoxyphosphogalactonate aldolase